MEEQMMNRDYNHIEAHKIWVTDMENNKHLQKQDPRHLLDIKPRKSKKK